MNKELQMIIAHRHGRQEAAEVFADIASKAMKQFKSVDEQFSFIAGCLGELRRIAKSHVGS